MIFVKAMVNVKHWRDQSHIHTTQKDNEQKMIEETNITFSKYAVWFSDPWKLRLRNEDSVSYVRECLYIDSP